MNDATLHSPCAQAPSRTPLALALAGALGIAAIPGLALANTYTVTSTGDAGSGTCSAACTLRDAVLAANGNPGADTIAFASTLSGDTIVLDIAGKDHIVITDNLTIQGPGANLLTVSGGNVASTHKGGIFEFAGDSLTVSDITLADGKSSDRGGALSFDNSGQLTLTRAAIQDCYAQSFGGGIYKNSGTLNVAYSTISGNHAGNFGGGLSSNYAVTSLVDSTISGNSAGGFGGGIYGRMSGSGLTVTNSTISGNSAGAEGGGFLLFKSDATLTNSIVANNTANYGAEFFAGTQGYVSSNVVANNTLIEGSYAFSPSGGTFSGANNLFGLDPKLGPLTNNGGPTQTLALLPGSPAIDAGENGACEANDQRGVARPYDGDQNGSAVCDMGAFEVGFDDLDTIFANGFD